MRCVLRILLAIIGFTILGKILIDVLNDEFSDVKVVHDGIKKTDDVITIVKVFPQSGGDVKFDQPWSLPEVNVIKTEMELDETIPGGRFIISNFTYSKGLGNLMFQWASISSIAEEHKATVLLSSDCLLRRAFELKAAIVTPQFYDQLLQKHASTAILFNDCCSFSNVSNIFKENEKFVSIIGYMQNTRWFHTDNSDLVLGQFTFLPKITEMANEEIEGAKARRLLARSSMHSVDGLDTDPIYKINNDDVYTTPLLVGVHVRRGFDLTSNSRNIRHGHVAAPAEYYNKEMDKIRQELGDRVLFLLATDDKTWAKKNIKENVKGEIQFTNGKYREVDMSILSSTDRLIISTGTFSWWAAYLAEDTQVTYYNGWPSPGSELDKMINKTEYFLSTWKGSL